MSIYPSRPIRIGTWQGVAYQADGRWYVRPLLICESMGLAWTAQEQIIKRNYPRALARLEIPNKLGRRDRPLMMLPVSVALVWVARLGAAGRASQELKDRIAEMHAALGAQFEQRVELFFDGASLPALPASIDDFGKAYGADLGPTYSESVGRTPRFLRSFAALLKGGRRDA